MKSRKTETATAAAKRLSRELRQLGWATDYTSDAMTRFSGVIGEFTSPDGKVVIYLIPPVMRYSYAQDGNHYLAARLALHQKFAGEKASNIDYFARAYVAYMEGAD